MRRFTRRAAIQNKPKFDESRIWLNINPKFVLLTNNPDKVDAMNSLNINIISTGAI